MELVAHHPSGEQNFEAAPSCFKKLLTPDKHRLWAKRGTESVLGDRISHKNSVQCYRQIIHKYVTLRQL
jgi:hypothetical protein